MYMETEHGSCSVFMVGFIKRHYHAPSQLRAGLRGTGLDDILVELLHHQGIWEIGFGFG